MKGLVWEVEIGFDILELYESVFDKSMWLFVFFVVRWGRGWDEGGCLWVRCWMWIGIGLEGFE